MASSGKSVGVVPAPPGQVANFVNPVTRKGDNIALHTVMLFFVTLSVGIRLYTRHFITHQLGLDDCKKSLSLSLSYANTLERRFMCARICGEYILGRHLWDISLPNFILGQKLEVVAKCIYLVLSATIKLSCFIFYRRLFAPSLLMRRVIHAGVIFVLATYTALLITSILNCLPVEKHYNPIVSGHCLPAGSPAYSSGALNVVTDAFVVFLPLPAIWHLNMKLSRRLKLMTVFGLGISVVAVSITRVAETPIIFKDEDSTWQLSTLAMYTILEMDIGLICACLLAFPAFIDRYGPGFMNRLRSYTRLRRTATREISASTGQAGTSGNGKNPRYGSNEYAKLAGGTSAVMMHDIGPETIDPSYRSSHRGNVGHEDTSQSLQSPPPIASVHMV